MPIVAVGQLSLVDQNDALIANNTAPPNPAIDSLWLNTAETPNKLMRWTGSAWVKAGVHSASDLGVYTKAETDNKVSSQIDLKTGNLVNNTTLTGTVDRWTRSTSSSNTLTAFSTDFNGATVPVIRSVSTVDVQIYSDYFDVDPSKAYEFSIWIKGSATTGQNYFGLNTTDGTNTVSVTPVVLSSGTAGTATTNPYFWSSSKSTEWRKLTAYLLPYGTDPAKVKGLTTSTSTAFIMSATTKKARLRFLNWSNAGASVETLVANPIVTECNLDLILDTLSMASLADSWKYTGTVEINGGKIKADTITATQIAGRTITAAQIASGTITANEIKVNSLSALSADLGTVTAGTVTGVSFSSKPLVLQDVIGRRWTEKTEIGMNGVGFRTSAVVNTADNSGKYADQETTIDNDGVMISTRDDNTGLFSFTSMSGSSIQFGGTTSNLAPYGQHFINGDGELYIDAQYKMSIGCQKGDLNLDASQGTVRVNAPLSTKNITVAGTISASSLISGRLKHTNGYFEMQPFNSSYEGVYDYGQLFFDGKANYWRFSSRANGSTVTTKLQASAFDTSSSIKYKENIQQFNEDALSVINSLNVKTYNFIGSDITERRLGLIIEDGVPEPIVTKAGDSIDLYAMSAYLWKAVQQLTRMVDAQQQSIEYLAEEVEKSKALVEVSL